MIGYRLDLFYGYNKTILLVGITENNIQKNISFL